MRQAVALPALLAAALLGIAGCSLPGPLPAEYVLGAAPAATATTVPQTGLPVVEIKRIRLPDYLDTTDILERRGNQLVPSPTGRWGERLSLGLSRALADALGGRLPRMLVTAAPPVTRPTRQILVDVSAFEVREDHQVLVVARWTITDGAGGRVLVAEQTSIIEPLAGTGDGAVVAAMSQAVGKLAERLAAGIDIDDRPR